MRWLGWVLVIAGVLGLVYAFGGRLGLQRGSSRAPDCVNASNHGSDKGVPRKDGRGPDAASTSGSSAAVQPSSPGARAARSCSRAFGFSAPILVTPPEPQDPNGHWTTGYPLTREALRRDRFACQADDATITLLRDGDCPPHNPSVRPRPIVVGVVPGEEELVDALRYLPPGSHVY